MHHISYPSPSRTASLMSLIIPSETGITFVRLVMDCMFKGIVEQHDLTFGPSAVAATPNRCGDREAKNESA